MRRFGGRFAQSLIAHALFCLLILLTGTQVHATIGVTNQMLLGNPSNATADANNHTHYLIQRDVEAMDYNDSHRQPNWASWNYTPDDSGTSGRGSFAQDTSLPPGFYRVLTSDYSGSGYDRGHMCPSGDRTVSVAINNETFLMSNMIPQAPDNNQGVWANLENYSRAIAASNEVLITCGPEGFGPDRTASSGQIPIASNVWKIIVAVPLGSGKTLDRITNSTRVIAVNIPNLQGVRSDPWQDYLTSVNQLQTNTGYTFFTALNSNVAAVLRAKFDGAPATSITSFTPTTGSTSNAVVLTGSNFSGVTEVRFNGQPTTFTVNYSTQIIARVPSGASTGPLSIIAAGGLATSATTFTVNSTKPPPVTLSITLVSSNLVLSWPSSATGYALQQSPTVTSGSWSNFVGAVSEDGTNKIVTLPNPESRLFFRLISQ